ncbi:MAG: glutamine-hydrolyzing GMP synthase [Patescibacteria group bacterium]|nr:glutamine-hydrolyzing GMP synthase [Patescibacteria group bacterium]
MILIVDFGSQTTHLIGRRLNYLGFENEIINPNDANKKLKSISKSIKGIIFSGGPASVYEKNAPSINKEIFKLNIPILGICYGLQSIAYLLGGKVISKNREYGPEKLLIKSKSFLFESFPQQSIVWMSHGDQVVKLPFGFKILASTKKVKETAIGDEKRKIYGVQFHPEIHHTEMGNLLLENFAKKICGLLPEKKPFLVKEIVDQIKNQWLSQNQGKAISAVSGGVDSTVATLLVQKAIGKNVVPIYIDTGLMRDENEKAVKKFFKDNLKIIRAKRIFLKKLKNITNPEKKRKIIGKTYIEIFEKEAKKIKDAKFLVQGTIYSDIVESGQSKGNSAKIKSHHNVGGLPKKMNLKLIEPLKNYYKDEVRLIGKMLGLPKEVINIQPFPGPGYAIRIIGKVTEKRVEKIKKIDKILNNILKKHDIFQKIFQSFPVLTGIKSTAVKGDERVYGEVVAIRIYESVDIMSASWAKIPYHVLDEIVKEITEKIPDISRVVYDISTKPPSTMEWE